MSGNYGEYNGRLGKVMGGRNQNTLTLRDGTFKFSPKHYKVDKFLEGQSNILISGCHIQVDDDDGLKFANSKNTKFENTRFRGKKGMPKVLGENLLFENCTFTNTYRERVVNTPRKTQ